jgi:hypothetical protein
VVTDCANPPSEQDEFLYEQNETVTRIEELLGYLTTSNDTKPSEDTQSMSSTTTQSDTNSTNVVAGQLQLPGQLNITQLPNHSYVELLALYDRERNIRLDLESNFKEKSKESKKQVCDLKTKKSTI